MSQALSTTLTCTENGSDKVYAIQIVASGDGYQVNAQWGRRGSTLQCGSKTPQPVPYEKALKVYEKTIAEKRAKGYVEGEGETPYQNTAAAGRFTGILPQLLNPIPRADIDSLLDDDDMAGQQKYDGRHQLLLKNAEGITGINKKGFVVAVSAALEAAALAHPCEQFLLDGESIGDTLIVHDILEWNGTNLREQPYHERYRRVEIAFSAFEATALIRPAGIALGREAKRALLAKLDAASAEGMVFKRRSATVTPGRPNSGGDQIKVKFWEDCSAVVSAITEGKRSVSLRMFEADGTPVDVGRVTIAQSVAIPPVGSIVSIKYLYAFPDGGCLYQPEYRGVRDDQDHSDCGTAQLKYKPADLLAA